MRTMLTCVACASALTMAASAHCAEPVAANEQVYMITVRYFEAATANPRDAQEGSAKLMSKDEVATLMKARQDDRNVETLCAPTISLLNGHEAKVQSGGDQVFTVGYDDAGPVTQTVPIGTRMTVKPTGLDDGRVRVAVALEHATITCVTAQSVRQPGSRTKRRIEVPQVDKRALNTTADLREGQFVLVTGPKQTRHGRQIRSEMLVTVDRFKESEKPQ